MLCSISNGKSGSKWLDRLRLAKGFPSDDDINLDQFLKHQNSALPDAVADISEPEAINNLSNQTPPERELIFCASNRAPTPAAPEEDGGKVLLNAFSNVLAELFNMGDPSNIPSNRGKRGSRKQPNPRNFLTSTSSSDVIKGSCENLQTKNDTASPMSDDNSRVGTEKPNQQVKLVEQQQEANLAEDEEQIHASLSGFSRTEVMVIDTSCAPWKFEKLLFRKKNAWKVRDKKSKSLSLGKIKKRKVNPEMNSATEKKQKVFSGQFASSKEGQQERISPSDVRQDKDNISEEASPKLLDVDPDAHIERQDDVRKRKMKAASSSVVLIKSIPTSKKAGSCSPKSCIKASHRQHRS